MMDFSRAWTTLLDMINGLIAALPDLILAVLIFLCFYYFARRTQFIVIHLTEKRQKARNLGVILGKLAQTSVIVAGLLVAMSVLFPSFRPGDLIQLLGIGSIAVGFAFRDVFQNFLAGILLLLTAPFKIGDQIAVADFEGTVEDIQTRATTLKTYDGRRVVIPNTDLFTQSVTVNTAFGRRRLAYEIIIGYEADIDEVKRIIQQALYSIEDVLHDPPVDTLVSALSDAGVTLHILCWTRAPGHMDLLHLQDQMLTVLKNRLTEHNIDLFPSQPVLIKHLAEANHKDGAGNGHEDLLSSTL
jgi:small-conductance mechanosensitive channel